MIIITDENDDELMSFCVNLLYETGASETDVHSFCTAVSYDDWLLPDYRESMREKVIDTYGVKYWRSLNEKYAVMLRSKDHEAFMSFMLTNGALVMNNDRYQNFLMDVVENTDDNSLCAIAIDKMTNLKFLENLAISHESDSIRNKAFSRLKLVGRYSKTYWSVHRFRQELEL